MDFNADHFALFGLPAAFGIDRQLLETRYRDVQREVHPDRFAHAGEADRRRSVQWATRVNEAYQVLRKPLSRAQYLLHLQGVDIAADKNTAMAPDFLIEQMEWREAVEEARGGGDHHALERLHGRLRQAMDARYTELATFLDAQHSLPSAAECVRKLMFLERLESEIDDALADLDDR